MFTFHKIVGRKKHPYYLQTICALKINFMVLQGEKFKFGQTSQNNAHILHKESICEVTIKILNCLQNISFHCIYVILTCDVHVKEPAWAAGTRSICHGINDHPHRKWKWSFMCDEGLKASIYNNVR
jgi:hypothetical protein